MKPTIIALYLPQYYPFKENDEWWGKGFTEWTNVGKAKPLFKGHDQPRVPADLGYYDLRVPEVREQQAELAREAGVTAFCYWHYWFGNGRQLLADVFNEVLETGKPDFPFCLGWANHSWYAKTWDKNVRQDKLLIEQTYPGIDDAKQHFEFLLKAFKDPRYLKIEGKPFLYIFDGESLPVDYISLFRKWTKDAGFKDLFLATITMKFSEKENFIKKGYSAIVPDRVTFFRHLEYNKMRKSDYYYYKIVRRLRELLTGKPRCALDYGKHYHSFIDETFDSSNDVIPQILPNWDHSPRSGKKFLTLFYNAKPEYFREMVREALRVIKNKPEGLQILLLKSWNEWGEGNYMEPDLTYRHGYIEALRDAINQP